MTMPKFRIKVTPVIQQHEAIYYIEADSEDDAIQKGVELFKQGHDYITYPVEAEYISEFLRA